MTRVTPRLLFLVGVLLAALWLASPLSSSPPAARGASAPVAAPPPLPELDEMIWEVDRLEERLGKPVRPAAPDRDPFQFAPRSAPLVTSAQAVDLAARPDVVDTPPAIVWPVLVAIVGPGSGDSTVGPRAVFEDRASLLHVRGVGEVHGAFAVSAINDDAVTVVHVPSRRETTLTLR